MINPKCLSLHRYRLLKRIIDNGNIEDYPKCIIDELKPLGGNLDKAVYTIKRAKEVNKRDSAIKEITRIDKKYKKGVK